MVGQRSARAQAYMREKYGYTQVKNFTGSWQQWSQSNK